MERAIDRPGRVILTHIITRQPLTSPNATKEWGGSVIAAAQTVETQMAQIWPTKTTAQLYAMLGVTPMIGRNDTGRSPAVIIPAGTVSEPLFWDSGTSFIAPYTDDADHDGYERCSVDGQCHDLGIPGNALVARVYHG